MLSRHSCLADQPPLAGRPIGSNLVTDLLQEFVAGNIVIGGQFADHRLQPFMKLVRRLLNLKACLRSLTGAQRPFYEQAIEPAANVRECFGLQHFRPEKMTLFGVELIGRQPE